MTQTLTTRISLPDDDDAEIEVEYEYECSRRSVTIHAITHNGNDITHSLKPRQVARLYSECAEDHDERLSSAWDSYQCARRDLRDSSDLG